MSGFKQFNRITTDYAEVLNVLFNDFIMFVGLQYKGILIGKDDIGKLIDSESHNDLSKTLKKYRQPIWRHNSIRDGSKFSLNALLSHYNKLKHTNRNASVIQFIDAQEIGPRRINIICSIASSIYELRNKIAHGDYVKNEAEASFYWSNLAQLIMSYPPKLIKKDDIKQKFADMDEFIKGDLLQSWISFYQEDENANTEEDNNFSIEKNTTISEETRSVNDTIQAAISDLFEILESHNNEVLQKIIEIKNQSGNTTKQDEEDDSDIEENDFEQIATKEIQEMLTEEEAKSELKQLSNRIHQEMRYKHNKKMQNWECIVQWALIHEILETRPKDKNEFKQSYAFQKYFNSEQSNKATEQSKVNAKSLMNFQLDFYWKDIKEIIERIQRN